MDRRTALALGASVVATASTPAIVHATPTDTTGETASFEPLGTVTVENAREAVVSADEETTYVAAMDGFAVVDVSDPASPEVLVERRGLLGDREDGPLQGIQDVSVDGNRLLVVGPANSHSGLQAALVYDVSDPSSPERLAVHETDFPIHNAFLDGRYAYLTADDGDRNPLVIVDVREPTVVAEWSLLDHDEDWSEVDPTLRTLHDVWVGDDVAALAHWDAGTVLLDVSDPTSPRFLSRAAERTVEELSDAEPAEAGRLPGNDHYSVLDPGGELLAIGREAWSNDPSNAPGGIELWDVSTVTEPTRLSRIPPPPTPDPSFQGLWTTAHNFDLQDGRLYSSWYQGGVKIHDVSNPADPEEIAWWREPQRTRFWTAQQAGDSVIASSIGVDGSPAGLYLFPDRAGRQPDPPPLTAAPTSSADGSTTGTPGGKHVHGNGSSPTRHSSGEHSHPTDTVSPRASATAIPSDTVTRTTSPTASRSRDRSNAETTTDGQAGLGALAGLVGLTGGALAYRRRD